MFQNLNIRIDDRFIHGQIILSWFKVMEAEKIIIIDDEIVENPIMYTMFQMALPEEIDFEVFSCEAGIQYVKSHRDVRLLVLIQSIQVLEQLYLSDVRFKEITIGRLPYKKGRKKKYSNVYLTENEEKILKYFLNNGVEIVVQMVPDSDKYYLKLG